MNSVFATTASASSAHSLRTITILGSVASVALALLSFVRGWPFTSLTVSPWFVQFTLYSASARSAACVLYFIALAALCWAWMRLSALARRGAIARKSHVWWIFCAWAAPLLFSTPLGSGDVFVYFVDGQALARGFDRYVEGVSAMGADTLVNMVHPIWRDTNTMYGPLSMKLAERIALLVPHSIAGGVLLFRALCVVCVAVTGFALSRVARSISMECNIDITRSVSETRAECAPHTTAEISALVFVLTNPLTLVHLVSASHNDAMMVALVGCALMIGMTQVDFARGWTVRNVALALLALLLASASGAFKLPGFAGVFVLGWYWAGLRASFVRRILYVSAAGVVGLLWFALQAIVTGLGWGWLHASAVPGVAQPLFAPANAFGVALGGMFGAQHGAVVIVRMLCTVLAVVSAVVLVLRTRHDATQDRVVAAFGIALLVIAWLGPALYPWYFVWGAVLVGVTSSVRARRIVEKVLVISMFFVMPGGFGVLDIPKGFSHTVVALLVTAIYLLVVYKLEPWPFVDVAKADISSSVDPPRPSASKDDKERGKGLEG